tara:strand:+ start:1571 stop:1948 length:378 start_codon:yes stop_codon:yes gene_type:complete
MKKTTAVIIKKGDKVLLEKRLNTPYKNYWVLPGGHVDKKESPLDTVKRETEEETGIEISPMYLTSMEERIPSINWKAELYVFGADTNKNPKPDNNETSETKFFSKKELKNLRIGFKHKEILTKYL